MINFKRHFIIILLLPTFCYCQVKTDSLINIWNNHKLENAVRANAFNEHISKYYFDNKTDSAFILVQDLIEFTNQNALKKEKADALILLGNIKHIFNDNPEATSCFKQSLKIYNEIGYIKGKASALNSLGVSFRKIYKLDDALKHFKESLEISEELKDASAIATSLFSIGSVYLWRYKNDEALDYFMQSISLSRKINDRRAEAAALNNIASAYNQKKEYNKAKKTINEAIKISLDLNNYNLLANNYAVLANTYQKLNDYDNLIKTAELILEYANKISYNQKIDSAYYFFFQGYKGKKDFDLTMKYYDLRKKQRTTMEDIASSKILEKIKLDNEKEKDSLINVAKELKASIAHKKEKTNLTLIWGSILSTFSIFVFIAYRNTKRKQRIVKQQKEIEIQKQEKILKEFELSAINAMIEGQEKERKRIAEDLHDDLGGLMATVKLHFNALKDDNSAELFDKTNQLIDEAYKKVRTIAHAKNAGVIAKEGLLKAVKNMAEKISASNKITIDVKDFGLESRLENSLELTIFRIIQELITNVIKHAEATETNIHLTNHKKSLNIIIEDNGIGFNTNHITRTNKGMGIHSIDKRVEHLEGTMTIESEIKKGTTVIIDIPI